MEATLLVELLTEELPPKSLAKLGNSFATGIRQELIDALLVAPEAKWNWYATPRRLAMRIEDVADQQAPRLVTDKIMPVSVALDKNGKPTQALLKKLQAKGFKVPDISAFDRRMDGKTETFYFQWTDSGFALVQLLADFVSSAVSKLPVSKLMRWGAGDDQFVRPVHGLLMLHGTQAMPGTVLGASAGNRTRGHRFLGNDELTLANSDEYESKLREKGMVIVDFQKRKSEIDKQLQTEAQQQKASLGEYQPLLDEVTALVEYPSVYVGEFDKAFLEMPQECLILTMQKNQKYFPLFAASGKLLPKFLIVSNMKIADPRNIIDGNQRVVRPRLDDARFFFNQDCKTPLAERVQQLAKVIYHNKLGSQLDRVKRLESVARQFAGILKGEHVWGADEDKAKSAAYLAKADLLTGMVGEFPELQGIMGAHYARHEGIDSEIAQAIEDHYLPRFSGDRLPLSTTGIVVALADKLDSIFGMFGIGQIPTGEKDPFALRRQALGVIRLIVEKKLPLSLDVIFRASEDALHARIANGVGEKVYEFLLDRLRSYLREQAYEANEIESVLALSPKRLDHVPAMLSAVRAFKALPEAQSLAAANKRIRNIIHKSDPPTRDMFSIAALKEPAERALHDAFKGIDEAAGTHLLEGRYKEALLSLAALKNPVDAFFDTVMVNVDDQVLRNNRLVLLMQLDSAMNRVADISKLAVEK